MKKYIFLFLCFYSFSIFAIKNVKALEHKHEISGIFLDKQHIYKYLIWDKYQKADSGVSAMYEYSLKNFRDFIFITVGTNFSTWRLNYDDVHIISLFVNFRFFAGHFNNFSPYLIGTIAGPSLMDKRIVGGRNLGSRFLFEDMAGAGVIIFNNLDISMRWYHYSHAGLFDEHNPGLDVPFSLTFGLQF